METQIIKYVEQLYKWYRDKSLSKELVESQLMDVKVCIKILYVSETIKQRTYSRIDFYIDEVLERMKK